MKKLFIIFLLLGLIRGVGVADSAIDSLAARVTEGTSTGRIEFKLAVDSSDNNLHDWYRLTPIDDNRLLIEGNNNISMAVGLNHYLKHVAGIHISWNNLTEPLPDKLKLPSEPIFRETDLKDRYYLNYCTFSYSMPFWDEERWMKELDWMALHGINMALSLTGTEVVWKNLLEKYGYSQEEITWFVPGPAYMAWWLMGNLEGWGGPLPESWFDNQEALQKKIVTRMRELGIRQVLPGYSGMIPSSFERITGTPITDTGLWCGFPRPALISTADSVFNDFADAYYRELEDLYGKADFYSMDPFHEGGNIDAVDLPKVGRMIYDAMKRANPTSTWVIQSWQENPRQAILDTVPTGDLLILDLYSEKIPKWERNKGYGDHEWAYCMLLNFGGNIGMHGRVNSLVDGLQRARNSKKSPMLRGIGATPEGIENNPVMYELLFELPWYNDSIEAQCFLSRYLTARYGSSPEPGILEAWNALFNTVYNAPLDYPGEGTVESLICARPSWNPRSASTWGNSTLFYLPDSTAKAAALMEQHFDKYSENKNFVYDYIDIKRQANADEANRLLRSINTYREQSEADSVEHLSQQFLALILRQDSLLSLLPETSVDSWIKAAEDMGVDEASKSLYRKNAAMLVTVWGDSIASNAGGLHDYSHREWGGLIRELYYPRWKAFFDHELHGSPAPDYYRMEKEWVERKEKGDISH